MYYEKMTKEKKKKKKKQNVAGGFRRTCVVLNIDGCSVEVVVQNGSFLSYSTCRTAFIRQPSK